MTATLSASRRLRRALSAAGLSTLLLCDAVPAFAQVYKCQGADGRIAYAAMPCSKAAGQQSLGELAAGRSTVAAASAGSAGGSRGGRAPAPGGPAEPADNDMRQACQGLQAQIVGARHEIDGLGLDSAASRQADPTGGERAARIAGVRVRISDLERQGRVKHCERIGPAVGSAAALAPGGPELAAMPERTAAPGR